MARFTAGGSPVTRDARSASAHSLGTRSSPTGWGRGRRINLDWSRPMAQRASRSATVPAAHPPQSARPRPEPRRDHSRRGRQRLARRATTRARTTSPHPGTTASALTAALASRDTTGPVIAIGDAGRGGQPRRRPRRGRRPGSRFRLVCPGLVGPRSGAGDRRNRIAAWQPPSGRRRGCRREPAVPRIPTNDPAEARGGAGRRRQSGYRRSRTD